MLWWGRSFSRRDKKETSDSTKGEQRGGEGPFQRGLVCEFELLGDIRFDAFNVMVFCEDCTNVYIVAALC